MQGDWATEAGVAAHHPLHLALVLVPAGPGPRAAGGICVNVTRVALAGGDRRVRAAPPDVVAVRPRSAVEVRPRLRKIRIHAAAVGTDEAGVVGDLSHELLAGAGDLHGAGTADADRLEVLRAHRGTVLTRAGAVDHHGRRAEQMLAGLTDGAYAGRVGTHLVHDSDVGLEVAEAPQLPGVPDGHVLVLDADPDRTRRLALDDHGVPPRELQVGREVATGVTGARPVEGACRQKRGDGQPASVGDPRAVQRTGPVDDLVLGGIRMRSRRDLVPQDLEAESLPTDEVLVLGDGVFRTDRARCQVDPEYLPGPTLVVRHSFSS